MWMGLSIFPVLRFAKWLDLIISYLCGLCPVSGYYPILYSIWNWQVPMFAPDPLTWSKTFVASASFSLLYNIILVLYRTKSPINAGAILNFVKPLRDRT